MKHDLKHQGAEIAVCGHGSCDRFPNGFERDVIFGEVAGLSWDGFDEAHGVSGSDIRHRVDKQIPVLSADIEALETVLHRAALGLRQRPVGHSRDVIDSPRVVQGIIDRGHRLLRQEAPEKPVKFEFELVEFEC